MELQISFRVRQNLLITVALLICFSAIFYTYYKPTVNWLKWPIVSRSNSCSDICIKALKMPNQMEIVNNTCMVNFTSIKILVTQSEPVTQTDPDTILLIWMWPFGQKFDLGICSSQFNIHGCRLTNDRSQFKNSHGFLFHHRDIHEDDMPTLQRPPFQKWIWMNMESPSNSPPRSTLNNLFNLTTTYRQDSDIMIPYGRILEKTGGSTTFKIPYKNKLVCWIVSNWNSNTHKRSQYYENLKQHISIETYGHSFRRPVRDEDYLDLVSSCKFYLSFENSIHKDYITEKLYNPLNLGTVPVVLGPPRKNYEELIPGNAFIHVDDFSSPKELAEHLKLLDQNESLYRQYFTWREHFVSSTTSFGLEHACWACDHIRRNKNYRVVNDLSSWYWG
ncbi:4-galactosyl-N-acetylglucosaminide 3-alpha-L-fucosyltransferase 9 [Labeo rohita]|uniref:Fucosyltransferase n=2 Tax=Labeo rohita TaxID=84645 RepID=A0ABQ8LRJ2_LABRO|nr:4-galactosyl-N-acetylglucosaminide 3-alpha-L-fucosyltransferase 9 [Labeo rohita]